MSHTHNGLKCLDTCGMYHLRVYWEWVDNYGNENRRTIATYVSSSLEELEYLLANHLSEEADISGMEYYPSDMCDFEQCTKYTGYERDVMWFDLQKKVNYNLDSDPNMPRIATAYFGAEIKQMRYGEFNSWCKGYWS